MDGEHDTVPHMLRTNGLKPTELILEITGREMRKTGFDERKMQDSESITHLR